MSSVKKIVMDSLVPMKISKLCEEDSSPDMVIGVVLGMLDGDRLEITNCFAFPHASDNDDGQQYQKYQMDVQKAYRAVNIDHFPVGWFQPAIHGNFVNKMFIETQMSYQAEIKESVAIMYDPLKTSKGCLSLKAFRFTPAMMELYEKQGLNFSPEALKEAKVGFDSMIEEIPIEIKFSALAGVLMNKLKRDHPIPEKVEYLNLSHGSSLEHQLHLLMTSVDELTQESGKFVQYQRSVAKYNQSKANFMQRKATENAARSARGEPPVPDSEFSKIPKPAPPAPRIDAMLASQQLSQYFQQIKKFSSQGLSRVFMAEAMDNTEV